MSRIKSKDVTMTLAGKTIAGCTSCSINVTSVFDETRCKEDNSFKREFLRCDWSGSVECVLGRETGSNYTLSALQTAANTGAKVAMVFSVPAGDSSTPAAHTLSGNVLISSLSVNAPVDGKATVSISVQGVGALTLA